MDHSLVAPRFGITNATVTIQINESSQEYDYYGSLLSYNVTFPSQVEVQAQEKTRFQLVVPYNTQVNGSIITGLCGQHNIPTVIQLLYSK